MNLRRKQELLYQERLQLGRKNGAVATPGRGVGDKEGQ
jgi:hypothetical protein